MILIHVFRMPVFYVMAGFFAALLLQRYGSRRAIANRFWRIAVPFVVGWIVIYPLVMFMAAFGRRGLDPAIDFILSGRFLDYAHPLHLWFLEYLIVFYVLAAIVVVALPRVVPSGHAHRTARPLPVGRAIGVGAAAAWRAVLPCPVAHDALLAG